ncbi:hypothetical protein [Sinobaca sp. H24]|nr:hypothetical protein [Sinobaca sp. H24]
MNNNDALKDNIQFQLVFPEASGIPPFFAGTGRIYVAAVEKQFVY